MKKNNKRIGDLGEAYAREYLCKKGYNIVRANYKNAFGEIDIVARLKGTYVFIEVKARQGTGFGTPAEAVTYQRQRRLINAANQYLAENGIDAPCRFDVIEIMCRYDGSRFEVRELNHIEDAVH